MTNKEIANVLMSLIKGHMDALEKLHNLFNKLVSGDDVDIHKENPFIIPPDPLNPVYTQLNIPLCHSNNTSVPKEPTYTVTGTVEDFVEYRKPTIGYMSEGMEEAHMLVEESDSRCGYDIYDHKAGRSVSDFAKTLGMSGAKMCNYLSRHNLMELSATGRRVPTKTAMEKGYFKKVISKYGGRNRIWHVITKEGEDKTLQLMKTDHKEVLRLAHPELLKK